MLVECYFCHVLSVQANHQTKFKRRGNGLYLSIGWVAKPCFKGNVIWQEMLPLSSETPYHSLPSDHSNWHPSHMQRTLTPHPIPISLIHCRTGTKSRTSSSISDSNQISSLDVVHWMQPCRYIFCGTKDLWTKGQVSVPHFPNIIMTQTVDTCIQTGGNG